MEKILRFIVIGLLIGLSSSYTLVTFSVLFAPNPTISGKELLNQLIIAAVLGMAIGLISMIFETEKISHTWQFVIHLVSVISCVLVAGFFGEWYDASNIASLVKILLSIFVIYVISWGISWLLQKRDIKEMNDFIQKRRRNS